MTDKELLQGLLTYFNNVMVDVEAGESFDKEVLPDYSGYDQEFRIDMIVELFNGMMEAYAHMKSVLMQISKDGKPLRTRNNMCWANIEDDLDAYEKSFDKNDEL